MSNFSIEQCTANECQRFRTIRLRALRDSPDAFGSTLAEDEARPVSEWQERLANPDVAQFLATGADGSDIGIVVGAPWVGLESTAGLFAMWVAPEARGTGVAAALVDQVIAWARAAGFAKLLLDVADNNAPAIALYASRGFMPNGDTDTLPPPREHITEHQRVLVLG